MKLAVIDLETGEIVQHLTKPLPAAPLPVSSQRQQGRVRLALASLRSYGRRQGSKFTGGDEVDELARELFAPKEIRKTKRK